MKDEAIIVEIADATAGDAAAILEIQKRAFYGQGVLYGDFTLPPLVQSEDSIVRDFEMHMFLKAVAGARIVGSVRGRMEGETCHISRLIVLPDHQNKGIGKRLMAAIEQKFSAARRYELFTGDKSEKNLALYGKLGYSEFQRKPQGRNVTLICMEKQNRTLNAKTTR